jgi:hypothetical protein
MVALAVRAAGCCDATLRVRWEVPVCTLTVRALGAAATLSIRHIDYLLEERIYGGTIALQGTLAAERVRLADGAGAWALDADGQLAAVLALEADETLALTGSVDAQRLQMLDAIGASALGANGTVLQDRDGNTISIWVDATPWGMEGVGALSGTINLVPPPISEVPVVGVDGAEIATISGLTVRVLVAGAVNVVGGAPAWAASGSVAADRVRLVEATGSWALGGADGLAAAYALTGAGSITLAGTGDVQSAKVTDLIDDIGGTYALAQPVTGPHQVRTSNERIIALVGGQELVCIDTILNLTTNRALQTAVQSYSSVGYAASSGVFLMSNGVPIRTQNEQLIEAIV